MKKYIIAAKMTLFIHIFFVVFLFAIVPMAFIKSTQLYALGYAIFLVLMWPIAKKITGYGCPLTHIENSFWKRSRSEKVYLGNCVPYYSKKIFGTSFMTKDRLKVLEKTVAIIPIFVIIIVTSQILL